MISIFVLSLFVWFGTQVGARGEEMAFSVTSTDSTVVLCRNYSGDQDDCENQEMDQLASSLLTCPKQTKKIPVQGANASTLRNKPYHMLTNCVPLCIVAGHSYGTIMK